MAMRSSSSSCRLASRCRGLMRSSSSLRRSSRIRQASATQYFLAIDRGKARILNVPIPNILETLSINLGTAYVNDFNAFGRVYQVRAQADQAFRLDRADILKLKVRSATGALVPLGTLIEIRDVTGPALVQRYNMYVSVPLQGNAAPGVSTGDALALME